MFFFMFCMTILTPVSISVVGMVMRKHPVRDRNWGMGYRSGRSIKSQEAWDFAQVYFGKVWLRTGAAMLVLSVPAMLPCMGESHGKVGLWGVILCMVECVVMILSILPVERALKRRF